MRIDEIRESNTAMQKKLNLNDDKQREIFMIGVLTDISETLALLVDVYAMVYGRVVSTKKDDNNAPKQ